MTKEQPTIYVGIDVPKDKLAVALAGGALRDEVVSLGTFETAPASVDCLLKKLSARGAPSLYAMRQAAQDMAFIGRCVRLRSSAVWSRLR